MHTSFLQNPKPKNPGNLSWNAPRIILHMDVETIQMYKFNVAIILMVIYIYIVLDRCINATGCGRGKIDGIN